MGVLLLGVTRAAACGGGSNGFEQEMGPLLFEQARSAQEFNGVIAPIFQEFSSTGNMATARAFAHRREETNKTHLNFVRIAAGWEVLEPPAKAESFHILALLMINFKLESLAHLVHRRRFRGGDRTTQPNFALGDQRAMGRGPGVMA